MTECLANNAGHIVGARASADVHRDIEGVVGQGCQEIRLQTTDDRNDDARVSALENFDRGRHSTGRRCGTRSDTEAPAALDCIGLQRLAQQRFVTDDLPRETGKFVAEGRWPRHGRFAIEQSNAKLGLELSERLADGLLCPPEVGRGSREPPVINHSEKVA